MIGMRDTIDAIDEQVSKGGADSVDFRNVAKRWADFSLSTFKGDLLRKALTVSASIADFCAELEDLG